MQAIEFNTKSLDRLRAADSSYEVKASNEKNLYCRVNKSGKITLFLYRKPRGQNTPVKVTIAEWGNVAWREVKSQADQIRAAMARGINPNDRKREYSQQQVEQDAQRSESDALQNITLGDAWENMMNDHYAPRLAKGSIRETTLQNYQYQINKTLKPHLDRPLRELLTVKFLVAENDRVTEQHGKGMANASGMVLKQVSDYTREEIIEALIGTDETCLMPEWPRARLKGKFWHENAPRSNFIQPSDMANWWQTLESFIDDDSRQRCKEAGHSFHDYMVFLLLTGCRKTEIYSNLTWDMLDLENGTMLIPEGLTKTCALAIPLSDYLWQLMVARKARIQPGSDSERVFRHCPKPAADLKIAVKLAGIKCSFHDLRRTFVTYADECDVGSRAERALVNHSTGKVDVHDGYKPLQEEKLRRATNKITNYILELAEVETV